MYTFLLVMCTFVDYGMVCSTPVEFKTLEACQFTKKHYTELAVRRPGDPSVLKARCIGIPKAKR